VYYIKILYIIGIIIREIRYLDAAKPDFTTDANAPPPSPPRRGNGSNGGDGAGNPIHRSREFSKSFDAFPLLRAAAAHCYARA
jgi:hypothetical protein